MGKNTSTPSPDSSRAGGGFGFDPHKELPKEETPAETIRRLTDEEVERRLSQELRKLFPDSLLLTADPGGKTPLEKIMARADPETERRILEGLVLLDTDQELLALRAKVLPPDLGTLEEKEAEKLIHDFTERFEEYAYARGALTAFLNGLLIKGTAGKAEGAFLDEEYAKVERKHIAAYLDEIEQYIENGPPQKGSNMRNPLYYKGGPHFRNIDAILANLKNIEQSGIKSNHPEAALALQRVQNLIAALEDTKKSDGPGNALYEHLKNQPPSMLEKPLKLAGLAAGSLFAVMSGFPALWAWWKEGKTPSQAQALMTALWASVPLGIAGVFRGSSKELKKMVQDGFEIAANAPFRDGALKMEEDARAKAVDELDGLVRNHFREMERIVHMDRWEEAHPQLKKLLGDGAEKSALLVALTQKEKELTDEERMQFLAFTFAKLRDRKTESLEGLQAMLKTENLRKLGLPK